MSNPYAREMEKSALNRLTRYIAENRHAFPEARTEALEAVGALRSTEKRVPGMQFGTRNKIQQLADAHDLHLKNWTGTHDPLTGTLHAMPDGRRGVQYTPGPNSHPYTPAKGRTGAGGTFNVVRGDNDLSLYASMSSKDPVTGKVDATLKIPGEHVSGHHYADAMADVISRHELSETKYSLDHLSRGRTLTMTPEMSGQVKAISGLVHPLGHNMPGGGSHPLPTLEQGVYSHLSPHVLREESNNLAVNPTAHHLAGSQGRGLVGNLWPIRHGPSLDMYPAPAYRPSEAGFVQAVSGTPYGSRHIPARSLRKYRDAPRDSYHPVYEKMDRDYLTRSPEDAMAETMRIGAVNRDSPISSQEVSAHQVPAELRDRVRDAVKRQRARTSRSD